MADGFRAPRTLTGRYVQLAPLAAEHADGLAVAARDPAIGAYLMGPPGRTPEALRGQIAELLDHQAEGTDLPFCQIHRSTGAPIGMTRYLRIERPDRKVEIGGTWLDSVWWRTPINTEAKFLLLRHAFEDEEFHRVVIQTDLRNERSQRAIARLGAVREGVMREDRLTPSGRFRTSVIFSVIASDWPRVKRRLEARLAQPWDGRPNGPT
jgi:RimJ/RimL family protein N-acetyltransferase